MHPAQFSDPALVEITYTRIRTFLLEERIKPSDQWFTVEQIANHLDLRPNLSLVFLALKLLKERGKVEADEDGHIRHVWASASTLTNYAGPNAR